MTGTATGYNILTDEEVAAEDFTHHTEEGVCVMPGLHAGQQAWPKFNDPADPPSMSISIGYSGDNVKSARCGCSMPLTPDVARSLAPTLVQAAAILDEQRIQ